MDQFAKVLFVFVTLPLFLYGCGVKEGAEFYSLQKQDNQLLNTVSNLQIQINDMVAENNRVRSELATNSQAVGFLIQDERQQELNYQKLQDQLSKIQKKLTQPPQPLSSPRS
jgi:chromosome segregation ATPase